MKDLGLVHQFAQELGSPTPAGDRTLDVFREAMAKGMGELDVSCLVLPLEEQAGFRLTKQPE